jgi:hypothetical protein
MRERITNRPTLTTPERRCSCGQTYRHPWAWAIVLPARRIVDLCAYCSRVLRYGDEGERAALAERLTHKDWRVAA